MILVIDMTEPFDIKDNHAAVADSGDFDGLSTPQPSECDTESEADTLAGDTEQLDDLESLDLDELVDAIDQAQILPTGISVNGNIDEKTKDKLSTSSHQTLNSSQYSITSKSIGTTIETSEMAISSKKESNPSTSNRQGQGEAQFSVNPIIHTSAMRQDADGKTNDKPSTSSHQTPNSSQSSSCSNSIGATIKSVNSEKISYNNKVSNHATSNRQGQGESQSTMTQKITASAARRENFLMSPSNYKEVNKRTTTGGGFDSSANVQSCSCGCCDYHSSTIGTNCDDTFTRHQYQREYMNQRMYLEHLDSSYRRCFDRNTNYYRDEDYDLLFYSNRIQNTHYSTGRVGRDVPYAGESRYNTSRASSERSVTSSEESEDSSSSSGSSQKVSASSQKKRDTSSRHIVRNFECSACHRKYSSLEELEEHQNADGDVTRHTDQPLVWVGGPCYRANPKNKPNCVIQ